jgi:hypothetical protein
MTYKSEADLLADIRIEIGTMHEIRLFRNNVGVLIDNKGQHVAFGLCPGSSDLIGWKSVVVTPDMVGKRFAVFLAIETKAQRGRLSDKQQRFIATVKEHGGLAGEARTLEDAYRIIEGADHER